MTLTPEIIAAIGTSIIAPIIAYLKVKGDTSKRTEKRDTQLALIEKRMADVEKKTDSIEDLKDSIAAINVTLAKIQAILEMYIRQHEKD